MTPRLYLFAATQSNTILILRREKKVWNLIRWTWTSGYERNADGTCHYWDHDVFVRGQWLCQAVLYPYCCALSPDGRYFGYVYAKFGVEYEYACHGVYSPVGWGSQPPLFSATLFCPQAAGSWTGLAFCQDGRASSGGTGWSWERRHPTDLEIAEPATPTVPTGFVEVDKTTGRATVNGRVFSVKDGRILAADGKVLLNTNGWAFEEVAPSWVTEATATAVAKS